MKVPNPKVDSALHVLKGAVEKVISAPLTTSVFADGNKGMLTVEYEASLTDSQTAEIEALANSKIAEDVPIETMEMERSGAEQKFGKVMYDKYPVPQHIKKLSILRIKDWNLNCCLGPHVKSTKEIGMIKITKAKLKPAKKELEISFEVKEVKEHLYIE